MSIINKMHQDFQQVQQEQPILASMPKKKRHLKDGSFVSYYFTDRLIFRAFLSYFYSG